MGISVQVKEFSRFAQDDGESLTKTATHLNDCTMLYTNSVEYIALLWVGASLGIQEC